MPRTLLFAVFAVLVGQSAAQPFEPEYNLVFDDSVLPEIYIDIDPASLGAILADIHSDKEYPARFIFDNGVIRDTVENVGFRLRGATARVPPKKSWKISFNTFEPGRKFHGLEKLNINSEHNDPSIMRSKLGWEIFSELAVPAARANHVKLYVNGSYYGLYMNVEHIDEQFLQSRFGNDDGALFKCLYPADLTYKGADPAAYQTPNRKPYDLTQGPSDGVGYAELAGFLDILNNTPNDLFRETIEAVFDVNGYVRTMAADVVLGNWDNYWFLNSNFYLYNDEGFWRFIPYDIDNTFGVDFVNGDWGTRNVYAWGHPTDPRPLARRILSVPEYRDRYTFYIRRLLEGPARSVAIYRYVDPIRLMIQAAAEADPYHRLQWGWRADSFQRSYTEPIGGHVEYGLYPFTTTRSSTALSQLEDVDVVPILSGLRHSPHRPAASDQIAFRVLVEDEEVPASVELRYRTGDGVARVVSMAHLGDGYFGAVLHAPNRHDLVAYSVAATDVQGQTGVSREMQVEVGHTGPSLVINELMADNETVLGDEFGEFDDWIEIYNPGDEAVSLSGYTMTDNLASPAKWSFPDVTIAPRDFVLIWADGQPEQGAMHASFRLDKEGEDVGLFDASGAPVSTVSFGELDGDVSYGRDPDGSETLGLLTRATPAASNNGTAVGIETREELAFSLEAYPNPFSSTVAIRMTVPDHGKLVAEVFDLIGRRVRLLLDGDVSAGPLSISWDGRDEAGNALGSGVYHVRVIGARGGTATRSMVLLR